MIIFIYDHDIDIVEEQKPFYFFKWLFSTLSFSIQVSETSTFDIVDSNGDSSSSGLVIVHKPKVSSPQSASVSCFVSSNQLNFQFLFYLNILWYIIMKLVLNYN